jgi:hypothetical protein
VALLHKAGACSAYGLPVYKQPPPLKSWLTAQEYVHVLSSYSSAVLYYGFEFTYWDTGVSAVCDDFPAFGRGCLAKALLNTSLANLLQHCCLSGMSGLAAAAEQLGLAPAGTAAAATKAAVSASDGMGMLWRIWCGQLLRLRPHVMLGLLAAAQPLQLQLQPAAVPVLVGCDCGELALSSSGQGGGGGAGAAPTAVGADAEGSRAAEPAAVLPPSRRKQGGSRQRIGRQLQRLGGLVRKVLRRL